MLQLLLLMRLENIDFGPLVYIVTYHLLLLVMLPFYLMNHTVSTGLIVVTVVLIMCIGISITAGYHRLYAHRTYQCSPLVEWIILFFATLATQGTALRWCFDHRRHHQYVDGEKDPYSIKKGFWYAHVLWFFHKDRPDIDPQVVPDLVQNQHLAFQHKHYVWLFVLFNALIVGGLGLVFGDLLGAFVFGFLVRTFFVHHTTWSINSVAHTWGSQSFSKEHTAVDNYLISLLTYGEGYHNYHHTFSSDYRNGVKWYHFDPTKWLICGLSIFGLTSDLRRISTYTIKRRLVQADKELVLSRISEMMHEQRDKLASRVEEVSSRVNSYIDALQKMRREYNEHLPREKLMELRQKMDEHKRNLAAEWVEWCRLVKQILRGEVAQYNNI